MGGRPVFVEDESGLVRRRGDPSDVLAVTRWVNPLRQAEVLETGAQVDRPARWILTWSGTLADHLFEPHPATWLRPGHEALGSLCARLRPGLDSAGRRICFVPHVRHVLSDVQSCLTFLREHEGQPFSVALAPATLLEAGMIEDIEDHLRRAFETLGPLVPVLLLPADETILPRAPLRRLLDEHLPPSVPIVLQLQPSPVF